MRGIGKVNSVGVNIQIIPSLSILGSKQQTFKSELGAGMGKDEQSATRTTLKRCCKRSPTVDLNFILADRNFRLFLSQLWWDSYDDTESYDSETKT